MCFKIESVSLLPLLMAEGREEVGQKGGLFVVVNLMKTHRIIGPEENF
jgi:hypothetical protein